MKAHLYDNMGVITLMQEDERISNAILNNSKLLEEIKSKFNYDNIEDIIKIGLAHSLAGNKNTKEFHVYLDVWNYAAIKLYQNGMKLLLADDALNVLKITKNNYIYSSDNPITIQLGLETVNLSQYINQVFSGYDETIKNKQIPESYKIIAQRIGEKPEDILFVSDNIKECIGARDANYGKVYFIKRDQEQKIQDDIIFINNLNLLI